MAAPLWDSEAGAGAGALSLYCIYRENYSTVGRFPVGLQIKRIQVVAYWSSTRDSIKAKLLLYYCCYAQSLVTVVNTAILTLLSTNRVL